MPLYRKSGKIKEAVDCTFNNCSFNRRLDMRQMDCLEEFDIIQDEIAGGDLTDNEVIPGSRERHLQRILDELEEEDKQGN